MNLLTMTLGQIVETGNNPFDFNYPIYDEIKEAFEDNFILHFYEHEINFPSYSVFKRRLRAKLTLIMPYYLQLYDTIDIIDNPFSTTEVREGYERVSKSKQENLSSSLNKALGSERAANGLLENATTDTVGERITDAKLNSTLISDTETEDRQTTDTRETTNEERDTAFESTQNVVTDETNKGSKSTYFADTPQVNFVVGDYDGNGVPTSLYATTVTLENTNNIMHGEQKTDTESNENMLREVDVIGEQVRNTNTTFNRVDDTHTTTNEDTDYTEGVKFKNTMQAQHTATNERSSTNVNKKDENNEGSLESNKSRSGYVGKTQAEMVRLYRSTFINIERMIYEECSDLFLGVY